MGNLPLPASIFKTETATESELGTERVVAKRICNSMIYYYTPIAAPSCSGTDPSTLAPLCPDSSSSGSESTLQPDYRPASRPLVLFFSWLGAQPGAAAKYRDLYLDRGMDVLLVQSSVTHFLWPQWGLQYGLEVLSVLEQPPFSGRSVVVHATSIGGFTFSQLLRHVAQEPKQHAGLVQRVKGHIYDSLVVGTLEHMATGLGKTLLPRFEGFVKTTAMLYFWLFKAYTADLYEKSVQVFYSCPISAPALFFSSEDDAMCSPAVMDKLLESWRRRGVMVHGRRWQRSTHAAHLRCHREEYLSTLHNYLEALHTSSPETDK